MFKAIIIISFIIFAIIFLAKSLKTKKKNRIQEPEQKQTLNPYQLLELEQELEPEQEQIPLYSKKKLITNNELNFYNKLKNIIKDEYLIQPQINLATIIKKNYNNFYANELNRNIDFGIFDKNTYELLLLIELNDSSHKARNRYIRDQKVKEILAIANIPLITFYSSYSNAEIYIFRKIKGILTKLNNFD